MMPKPSAALLACLLLAPVAALAQERFSEQIEITEVVVPVRVLVKGDAVAGLTRDDFELYDRGELQEILGFEVRRFPAGEAPAASAGSRAAFAEGRRLLLLFDFTFSRRIRLARALRDLRAGLEQQLAAADRVAVATFGETSGLNLLVGFTRDRDKLGLALDAVQAMLDAKDRRQRELLGALHDARFGGGGEGSTFEALRDELGTAAALAVLSGPVVYDEAEDAGVEIEQQESLWGPIKVRVEVDRREPVHTAQDEGGGGEATVRVLGLSLTELAYLLRELPAPKEILLLSEGFGGPVLQDARSLFYLEKALRALRDSGWTLHAIDAGGLAGLDESTFAAGSLLYLSASTGGELMENTNDFRGAARKILDRTSIVYLLSFQPREPGTPGAFNKLTVKLRDPPRGVTILHRPGYYAQRAPARREIFERRVDGAEWLLTNLEASELEVELFTETIVDPLGGVRVPIAVEVGGASLLASGVRKPTRVELLLAVLDGEQRVQSLLTGETVVDLARTRGALSSGGVRFVGELGVPPGEYRLRTLVRSHRDGEVFLRTSPLTITADEGAESASAPPGERRAEGWITVEAEQRSSYFR